MVKLRRITWLAFIVAMHACAPKIYQAKIVLMPDTQTYAEKYPAILNAQVNWIANNSGDINFVLQQGDLTQNNNPAEWTLIKDAFKKLDNNVPYVLAAGNHDMGSSAGNYADVRNTEMFNQYFPVSKMAGLPGFMETAEQNKMENAAYVFKTGKVKWLVVTLEFGPRNSILEWANRAIQKYPGHLVILNTHSYMYSDSTRQGIGDKWRPQAYGVGKDTGDAAVNDGEQIWEKLVKRNPNIRFVFSGHVLNSGIGTLVSTNDAGYPVYQMLANYQEGVKNSINGGNGFLRILKMNFRDKTLSVYTYSPFTNEYKMDAGQQFIFTDVMYTPVN